MGYEVPVARAGRPTVVTAAVACLYVLAAVQIASVIVALLSFGPMVDAARDYAGGTDEGDTIVTAQQVGSYIGFAFSALFAIGYAVLGIFTNRGKNPARIVSWVVLGIGLCCNAGGLVGTALGGVLPGAGGGNGSVDMTELQRRMKDATPAWATVSTYVLLTISLLAALAAIIALALPAANEFFRKVEPAWEPPVPGSVYPVSDQPPQAAPAAGEPAQAADPVQFAKPGESADPDQPGGSSPPPVP